MSTFKKLFTPQFRETPNGVFRPISKYAEIPPLVLAATWASIGIFGSQRFYLALAAVLLAGLAIRFTRLRKLGPEGSPLVATEGDTLVFHSLNAGRPKRFPLAEIQQVRIYGQVGYRYFSVTAAGDMVTVIPTSFRREPEQAIINFLQTALPGKVQVEPVPKTFFDRVRGDYS